jgi:hypothetical protein
MNTLDHNFLIFENILSLGVEYTDDLIHDNIIRKILSSVDARMQTNPIDVVMINYCLEIDYRPQCDSQLTWIAKVNFIKAKISEKYKNIKLIIVLNDWHLAQEDFLRGALHVDEMYFVAYYLLREYHRIVIHKEAEFSAAWDSHHDNILLLTGKPNKPNRIGLLYALLSDLQLREQMVWSLFMLDELREECFDILHKLYNISLDEFDTFVEMNCRTPDNITVLNNNGTIHYDGIPYQATMFNVAFAIVSETNMHKIADANFTEKTFRHIINHVPFIMAGERDSHLVLKHQYGFKMFEYLYDMPFEEFNPSNLNDVVAASKSWANNIQHHAVQVKADVEFNFDRLEYLARANLALFDTIIETNGLKNAIPTDLFRSKAGFFDGNHHVITMV